MISASDAPKPRWRGVLHQIACPVALGAGAVLVGAAPSSEAAWAGGIFAGALTWLLGVSAVYHRPRWTAAVRAWLRRLDHASIFVLIAGTGTPLCLLALPPSSGRLLLAIVWGGAAAGVLVSVLWVRAPKPVKTLMYVALGLAVVPFFSELQGAVDGTVLELIAAGGIAYVLGALIYAAKRPSPSPKVFGYHELFHALVLVAGGLHYAAVWLLVRTAGAAAG